MHIAWAGGNTMWSGNSSEAGGSSAPRDCHTGCPDFSEMSVSLCLGPCLRWVPAAASPTHLAKSKFRLLAMPMVGVEWGGLPRVRSSCGCLNINKEGLKTAHGLWDVSVLFSRREGWAPAHSHLSARIALEKNSFLGNGLLPTHGVLKWRICTVYMNNSWFLISPHALLGRSNF